MTKHKTNTQVITELMEHSRYGAMMQAFIIEACDRYARQIIESDGSSWPEHHFVSYDLWKNCANELYDVLTEHLTKDR